MLTKADSIRTKGKQQDQVWIDQLLHTHACKYDSQKVQVGRAGRTAATSGFSSMVSMGLVGNVVGMV